MTRYTFNDDLAIWRDYTLKIHSRNIEGSDFYVGTQSVVENIAHRYVANLNSDRSNMLEIGIGGGEHTLYQTKRGEFGSYTAVDIRQDFIDIAQKQFPEVKCIKINGTDLPFDNNSVTTAVAIGVLEHVVNLDTFLNNLKNVMAEGSKFFVVIPTNGCLLLNLFKLCVSYPSLLRKGIKRPDKIWHYENVNNLIRVEVFLERHFDIKTKKGIPFSLLGKHFSPLYFYECEVRRAGS